MARSLPTKVKVDSRGRRETVVWVRLFSGGGLDHPQPPIYGVEGVGFLPSLDPE